MTYCLGGRRAVEKWETRSAFQGGSTALGGDMGGSAAPYALTAGALNSLLSCSNFLHAAKIDLNQNMNVTAWRTADGHIHLMAADLEAGLRDDADRTRHANLVLPGSWKMQSMKDVWSNRKFAVRGQQLEINLNHAQSVLLTNTP